MTVARKLKQFLDEKKVKYEIRTHPVVYTAQELAAVEHIPGKQLAKVVVIKADGEFLMAVLPATHKVNLERLKEVLGKSEVGLASEEEFKDLFPQCDVGAMPPFGNLYGLAVFSDSTLEEDKEITFQAGSHYETITLKYKDFARLAQPKVEKFAEHL
jgi:Ala-tRNA(Pro) deacylase